MVKRFTSNTDSHFLVGREILPEWSAVSLDVGTFLGGTPPRPHGMVWYGMVWYGTAHPLVVTVTLPPVVMS